MSPINHSLRILIVNNSLDNFAGTELYVLELAKSLVKLGHKPVAYSTELGAIAHQLRMEGIPVTDDLNTIGIKPDIIHGHHHLDTLTALLHFTDVPAVYYCHGWLPRQESPLRFPRIYKYVAVCDLTVERLIVEGGLAPENIKILLNFVDLNRFKHRGPLPDQPRKVLAFSGFMNMDRFNLIKKACHQCGITRVDKIGDKIGETHFKPEAVLGEYDIIFAKGRAALEALATGAAVISCDGAGSMVTVQNLDRQRFSNFGLSERKYPYNIETIVHEIRQYNRGDAEQVSHLIRASSSKESIIEETVKLYYETIEVHRNKMNIDVTLEQKAVSNYLRWLKINFEKEVLRDNLSKLDFFSRVKFFFKKYLKK